jgi:hypothetical protein
VVQDLAACGLVMLADKDYAGLGEDVCIPYRRRNEPLCRRGRQPRRCSGFMVAEAQPTAQVLANLASSRC